MVQGRSPEDTQKVHSSEVLKAMRIKPDESLDISLEERRKAFVELLGDLEGEVINVDDI